MKNTVKIKNEEFERQFESQRESRVKMLDYQALLAAKVVTFNDWSKVFK